MDAFLAKVQNIDTIEEAITLLWEQLDTPLAATKHALHLAIDAHEGQTRKSGEPYIVHPILVACITAQFSNDETMVQAALLHDVVEDTPYTIEALEDTFDVDVAHLVEGLTKIVEMRDEELVPSVSNERLMNSALTFRKMLIASIKDIRVLVIKLCDRLHNMLTLEALNPEKQKRIAEETLVVYAPIAHRLGISRLKNYLEDLSFYYIYPKEYAAIDTYMSDNSQNLQFKLNGFMQKITEVMYQNGLNEEHFEIFGRVKHYYSIYLKMQRKGVSIDEVLDLLAIRIILKNPIDCYRVLGLLHIHFTPLISRFKDYIAIPKENGYKTIHTSLFKEEGIVEAQIRTKEMHRLAEYGVAAHWIYKEGDSSVNLKWLESLNYHNESVEDFYELAKSDLFSEDIIVFSPKGDYYTLPKDSVVLDFAYAIHSDIGDSAKEAFVNKHKSSLLRRLKNGDIVNVIKDDEAHLHCSWIDTVKTSKARDGMRSLCKTRIKESDFVSALNLLSTLFSQDSTQIEEIARKSHFYDSLYKVPNSLDNYKETIHQIATYIGTKEVRFWEFLKKGYKKPKLKQIEHFKFYTNKTIESVEFDYCCHPKIADQIVAFYKDSKAIIHHKLCKNAYKKVLAHEQMVFISWNNEKVSRYRLIISLQNQKGILADLLMKLSDLDLNVNSIELGIRSSDAAEYCQIEVESNTFNKRVIGEKLSQHFKLIEIISLDDAYNK